MTPPINDLPFDLVTSILQQVANLPAIPVARRLSTTRTPPLDPRTQVLALLKPLFDLNRFDPTTRTRLRTALLHLLLPHLDADRRYDLKERRLGAALARELELDVDALSCWDVGDAWGGQYARREIPVCLGEAVGREWERRHGSSRKCNSLTLLQVDTLLNELAAHSKWSSSRIKSQHSKPRPVTFILRQLFPQSISSFQASYITQTILRDVSPLLAPPPTAQRTVSLKEYDSKSRYLLYLTDALRLTGGPTAMRIWQRCADLRQAMLDLEDFEEHGTTPRVRVGINVQIPKCQKTTHLQRSLEAYARNGVDTLWAETKYDGERMQIHLDLSRPLGSQITIYSKSARDSTDDRASTHATIYTALGLPVPLQVKQAPSLMNRALTAARPASTVARSVVLEAEMVPFNEQTGKVEEFWKIVQCPGDNRAAWRSSGRQKSTDALTQLDADEVHPSPEGIRKELHLQLVFFDVLELDGRSLVETSYEDRRAVLARLVRTLPGWSMLAARSPIHISRGLLSATKELEAAFSSSAARFEEGLVLKPSKATYLQHRWQKMKRDYISGLGDTVDLVLLGASWDAKRARELNVAPTVLTTFHIGVRLESAISQPRFLILFKASYGLTRDALEFWNAWLADRGTPWAAGLSSGSTLGHSIEIPAGVAPPSVLLRQPLLVELYGASFQKIASSSHYELRWPRIEKIYPPKSINGGKAWTDAMSAADYKSTALMALGKGPSDVRASLHARLESQRGTGTSLDIGGLFSPRQVLTPVTCQLTSPTPKRSSTIRTSAGCGTSVSSVARPDARLRAAASDPCAPAPFSFKRKRHHDENWSQRSTTREPSSDDDDVDVRWINADPWKVSSTLKDGFNPLALATPRKRILPQRTSPDYSTEQTPVAFDARGTPLSRLIKIEDSAVALASDAAPPSPARPCALVRAPAMLPGHSDDSSPTNAFRLAARPMLGPATLRSVLQSSIVHLPSAHDVTLRPIKSGIAAPGAGGLPLRHAVSSPEQLRRSRSSSHLERLYLTRTESFRKMLLQNDQDAVLLLDPDCPRFQHDLDTYRHMSRAVSSPRAKVRVLSAWCVREQGRALDGSWERFRLAEL